MMAAALQGIASLNEISHFLIELVASSLLPRPHPVFIEVDKGNIPHMLERTPFATALPRHIARNLPLA